MADRAAHQTLRRPRRGNELRTAISIWQFGAAARAIEAERARSRRAASPPSVSITCSDLERESGKVDELYHAFREALQSSGESVERLSREKFEKFLLQKSDQIRKHRGQQLEFVVSVENGKARLKARVKS